MKRTGRATLAVILGAILLLAACAKKTETTASPAAGGGSPAGEPAAAAASYAGVEYEFQGADTLPAGTSQIELVNDGKEMHMIAMAKIDEGKTIEDVIAYLKTGKQKPPSWATQVKGGVPPVKPGATKTGKVPPLDAGTYVMLCFVTTKDGTPHALLGMVKQVTVA
ncbi:MAG: hypothetical protein WD757_07525 [Actinomycetota bacterium]